MKSLADYPSPDVPPLDVLLDDLDNGTLEERRNAAYGLGKHDDTNIAPRLISLLFDSDLYVRVYAIQSLRDLKDARATLPLCELLDEPQPEELILSNVTRALAAIGDARAVPTLIKTLDSTDPFTRTNAAYALGEIGDPSAIPALQLLEHDAVVPMRYHDDGGVSGAPAVNANAMKAIAKIRGEIPKIE
ncbi:HEAT repeat domain-containing protein [Novipirellula maiorica]|uniref:HEAT repeat domain-containing protein n=1 Tax=Novipirellula maiorica TaxID=1265734 RepID=UPI001360B690|nr:HEAT repeat domain-containing protein [Rhodopirellula maiorica]